MMKKVSVFVDVQNIYYTTKQQFNSNFDYNIMRMKNTLKKSVSKSLKNENTKLREENYKLKLENQSLKF